MKKLRLSRLTASFSLLTLLVSAICMLLMGSAGYAITQNGLVSVRASVPGPPPSVAATIDTPSNGAAFHDKQITVSGSCAEQDLVISIIDNGTFVGSAICGSNNRYSLTIDLFLGSNTLVARETDSLNQNGPDSLPVTVTYTLPSSTSPIPNPSTPTNPTKSGSSSAQNPVVTSLKLILDPHYVGYTNTESNQLLAVPLKISGGTTPYALHVDWGDGNESLSSKSAAGSFVVAHTYTQGGTYEATFQAGDNSGQEVTMHVVIIINGKPSSIAHVITNVTRKLNYPLWLEALIGLVLLVVGYILGLKSRRKEPSS